MRAHVLVEGFTEETFIAQVLQPYLLAHDIWVTPIVLTTKRLASGAKVRGGVSVWPKIEREIQLLLRDSGVGCVTTMLDFYRFPDDAPGMSNQTSPDPYTRVAHVEGEIQATFTDSRFFPYLSLHEFESLVLSHTEGIGELTDPPAKQAIQDTVAMHGDPERVNQTTPPSHVLKNAWPTYEKVLHGPLVTADAGIEALRSACPHFDAWISKLVACSD